MKKYNTIIIGGGASGVTCALRLLELNINDVLILERNDRLCKKLSATGNGQGNITNINLSELNYFSNSGSSDFAYKIIKAFDNDSLRQYIKKLGGLTVADDRGRVYPMSKQASSITDLFRFELDRKKAEVKLNSFVNKIEKINDEFYVQAQIKTENGEKTENFCCKSLVLACGGMASKNFGSDGNGYDLSKNLGIKISELAPSLVQLKSDDGIVKTLKGLRCDCKFNLCSSKKVVYANYGEIIFADYGITGNAVFNASAHYDKNIDYASIEFLPEIDEDTLKKVLYNKIIDYKLSYSDLLCGILPNVLGRAIIKRCNFNLNDRAEKDNIDIIVNEIKLFKLKIIGTMGFDNAQVTKGGVLLSEVDENLESVKVRNLYFTGEILDVDGECGGYNLQWAFSSGVKVAKSIFNNKNNG